MATAAAFFIQKFNVLTTDTSDVNFVGLMLTDQVRSQGMEISVQGAITTTFNIIANYAYTDAIMEVMNGGNHE